MKKNLIIASVFFLVGILVYSLWDKPSDNQLKVIVENFDEKTSIYDIHISYPQFPDLPDEFNKKIKGLLMQEVNNFKTTAEENFKARNETSTTDETIVSDFSYNSGWTVEQLNNKVVSFVIYTDFYQGGAHGGHKIYTFNYDVKNKREVTLDSLFNGTKSYLEKISKYSVNDLKNQLQMESNSLPNMAMLEEGTAPIKNNFSRFTVATNSVTFYFEEYQVAPYAAGQKEVIIPFSYIINSNTQ